MLVETHTTWTKCHHVEQTTNHGERLEKVVLHEIPHNPVARYHPEGIEEHIGQREEDHENESRQLRLVSDSNADHECRAKDQTSDVDQGEFKVEEGEEHDDDQDPPSQLHVALLLVSAQPGNAGKHGLDLATGLRQQKNQASTKSHVPAVLDKDKRGKKRGNKNVRTLQKCSQKSSKEERE